MNFLSRLEGGKCYSPGLKQIQKQMHREPPIFLFQKKKQNKIKNYFHIDCHYFLRVKFSYLDFSNWFIPGKLFSQDLEALRVKWFSKKGGIATFISLKPEVWKEFGRTLTFAWTKGVKKNVSA